jgi:hypothetical protein
VCRRRTSRTSEVESGVGVEFGLGVARRVWLLAEWFPQHHTFDYRVATATLMAEFISGAAEACLVPSTFFRSA